MIYGIGTDIVEIARIEQTNVDRLIRRILTERERQYLPVPAQQRLQYVAGRFAAKEALSKALGTGIGASFSFQDAEIIPNSKGKPEVQFSSTLLARFTEPDSLVVHLSISHTKQVAIAMVVLESCA